MGTKNDRQQALLKLIRDNRVETQDELVEKLRQSGFAATQGTVSRDIRDLHLVKVTGANGKSRYRQQLPAVQGEQPFIPILRQAAVRAEAAGNLVVVKTHVGMGGAVGAAVDAMPQLDCVGTLAGDDTLLIVARTERDASAICDLLASLIAEETD